MRIDDQAISREDVIRVNKIIDKYWDDINSETVSKEEFIQNSFGPDAVEILCGGETFIVTDRLEPNAIFFDEDRITNIACRELYQLVKQFRS